MHTCALSSSYVATNAAVSNSKTTGHHPAGITTGTGGHSVGANINTKTTGVTKPTVGDHNIATNKTTSHQPAGITTGAGGHSVVTDIKTTGVTKSTVGGHNIATNKTANRQPTGVTIGTESRHAVSYHNNTTTSITRPIAGDDSVTINRTTSHHPPAATHHGGHSVATGKDNKATHQPPAVTNSSIGGDHSSSRPDQGTYTSGKSLNVGGGRASSSSFNIVMIRL